LNRIGISGKISYLKCLTVGYGNKPLFPVILAEMGDRHVQDIIHSRKGIRQLNRTRTNELSVLPETSYLL
jgi:hypothetical protein